MKSNLNLSARHHSVKVFLGICTGLIFGAGCGLKEDDWTYHYSGPDYYYTNSNSESDYYYSRTSIPSLPTTHSSWGTQSGLGSSSWGLGDSYSAYGSSNSTSSLSSGLGTRSARPSWTDTPWPTLIGESGYSTPPRTTRISAAPSAPRHRRTATQQEETDSDFDGDVVRRPRDLVELFRQMLDTSLDDSFSLDATSPRQVSISPPPPRPPALPLPSDPKDLSACYNYAERKLDQELTYSERIDPELKTNFDSGRLLLTEYILPPSQTNSGPKVNLSYISADPFLYLHNINFDDLYPGAIEQTERIEISQKLVDAAMELAGENGEALRIAAFTASDSDEQLSPDRTQMEPAIVYNLGIDSTNVSTGLTKSPSEQQIYKRIKRIVEHRANDPEALGKFALSLANNQVEHRCVDGVEESLANAELQDFGEAIVAPVHAGEFISRVVTDSKTEFLLNHQKLFRESDDTSYHARTVIAQYLRRKLHFVLGIRGSAPGRVEYDWTNLNEEEEFSLEELIKRFVVGGRISNGEATLEFSPFNVDHLIRLLQDSRERGLAGPEGARQPYYFPEKVGQRFTNALLTNLLKDDETLWIAYNNLVRSTDMPSVHQQRVQDLREFIAKIDQLPQLQVRYRQLTEEKSSVDAQLLVANRDLQPGLDRINRLQERIEQVRSSLSRNAESNELTQLENELSQAVAQIAPTRTLRNNLLLRGNRLSGEISGLSTTIAEVSRPQARIEARSEIESLLSLIARGNPYFLPAPADSGRGRHPEDNVLFTREFWMYLLKKYRYVID